MDSKQTQNLEKPVETKSETNNVFVPYPTRGKETLVPFGMYIQPATVQIGEKKIGGHKIVAIKDNGLADQSKLLVGDLFVAIHNIFIDEKLLEAVLALFKNVSPKFSLILIRQDTTAAKYVSLKVTLELGFDDKDNVTIINSHTDDEVIFYYSHSVTLMTLSQQDNPVTKYVKATSGTSVTMETWNQKDDSNDYRYTLSLYNQVIGDEIAYTFYNEHQKGEIYTNAPDSDQMVLLPAQSPLEDPPSPSQLVAPTYSFFYPRSTGINDELGLEFVLLTGNYMEASDNGDLNVTPESVSRQDLPSQCRFLMTRDAS